MTASSHRSWGSWWTRKLSSFLQEGAPAAWKVLLPKGRESVEKSQEICALRIGGPAVTSYFTPTPPGEPAPLTLFPLGRVERAVECGGRPQSVPTNPVSWWVGAGTPHGTGPKRQHCLPWLRSHFSQQPLVWPWVGLAALYQQNGAPITGTHETSTHSFISSRAFLSPVLLCLHVFCREGWKMQAEWADTHPALSKEAPCRFTATVREKQTWICRACVLCLLVRGCQVGNSGHSSGSLGEKSRTRTPAVALGFKAGSPAAKLSLLAWPGWLNASQGGSWCLVSLV